MSSTAYPLFAELLIFTSLRMTSLLIATAAVMTKRTTWLARTLYLLAALIAISAALSIFLLPDIYVRETPNWFAQAFAQDIFDLFIVVPVLIISTNCFERGSRLGIFLLLGTLLFLFYTYVLFCFDVHFNSFFLVYCAILSVTFYAIVTILYRTDLSEVRARFYEKRNITLRATVLIVTAVLFGILWLSTDIPALLGDTIPQELIETTMPTNAVHVMDYAIFLPAFIISAILLLRRHSLGYLFVPTLLIFSVVMGLSIATLMAYMYFVGLVTEYSALVAMLIATGIQLAAFIIIARTVKRER